MNEDYEAGFAAGVRHHEALMAEATALYSTGAHYRAMQLIATEDRHPCPAEFVDDRLPGGKGCRLTAESHHLLAYGVMGENKELKRRLKELENGKEA